MTPQTYTGAPERGHIFMEQIDCLDVSLWTDIGLIGTSFLVGCELQGPIDDCGFVSDFSAVKSQIRSFCKSHLDHRFLAPTKHPHFELITHPQTGHAIWRPRHPISKDLFPWHYECPPSSVYACELAITDVPHITSYLPQRIEEAWRTHNPHLCQVQISIHLIQEHTLPSHGVLSSLASPSSPSALPPPSPSAPPSFFSYTHGIPNHQGLCHRLWHGHLSQIQIFEDHRRSPRIEKHICQNVFSQQGFHIAHLSQLRSTPWNVAEFGPHKHHTHMEYHGASGYFAATMPAERTLLLDSSTSIESLCHTVAGVLKHKHPKHSYTVKIYEGPHKGALCSL